MKTKYFSLYKTLLFLVLFSFIGVNIFAQTVIISPTGAGGFESGTTLAANGWTQLNGANGGWYPTTTTITNGTYNFYPINTRAFYFSNNAGTNWRYNTTPVSGCSHFYRDVTFPAGQTNITLTFQWNAYGESTYDILYVYLCPTTLTPVVNSPSGNSSVPAWSGSGSATLLGSYNLLTAGAGSISSITIPGANAGTTQRLVFSWKNDGSGGGEPPAAIDAISLVSAAPGAVANDNCAGAIALTPGACPATTGNVLGATQSVAGCSGTANDDVWYKFTATATAHEVFVYPSENFDPVLQVYSGTCASLTSASCADNNLMGELEGVTLSGLTIGNTYYIRVYDYYGGFPATTDFNIIVYNPILLNSSINLTTITNCCNRLWSSGYYTANYANNENNTVTFQAAAGSRVRLSFGTFVTQATNDVFKVYDGPTTASPLMFTYSGTPTVYMPDAVSSGTTLTVNFTTNNSNNAAGFDLTVKCEPIPSPPAACNGNQPASDNCSAATHICEPNGYCGNTSSYFTPDLPGNMCNGCALFGGSIENNSWISFTAAATTATLQFAVTNCTHNWGIQFGIYSGTSCNSYVLLTPASYTTSAQNGTQSITATGLTVGNQYYIMVDGFAGDVCDYTITVLAGIMTGVVSGPSPVCYGTNGSTYTMNASATGYNWTVPAGATITSGAGTNTITVNWGTASSGNVSCAATAGICNGATSDLAVTVTPTNTITLSSAAGTNAQTACINTALTNITYATTGATGATFSGLPTGVTGSWAGNVATITGTPSTTVGSPFSYTVNLTGGCGTISASGTITVTPNNTISLSSVAGTNAQTVCINTAITNITYATTGATGATFSGLPTGVTGSWAGNVATITGTPSTTVGSPFSYTVNLTGGCGTISASGTITVTPNNTISLSSVAGTNAQTVCINTAITNITYATTGATGATFSGLPTGVTGSWAGNVATITGTPSTTVGSPFSYTVNLTGGCGTISASGTITVTPNNTISLSSVAGTNAQTVCINTAITNITYATTGATGATFSGLPTGVTGSWAGNVATITGTPSTTVGSPFSYTVNLTGGCGTISASGTITVTPNNTISLSSVAGTNAQTVCINTAITNITYATTGATGATFSGLPTGVTGSWAGNVATITGTPSTTVGSPFSYTVNLTGGCGTISASGTITVTPNNTISLSSVAGTNAQTVCINTAITNITYATTGATGATFSGLPTGVTGSWAGNVATITGTPSTTAGSPFNYTVNLAGGCGTISASGTITVTPDNTVTLTSVAGTNAQTVCINTSITNIIYSTTGATGATFSGLPTGVSGSWVGNVATINGTPTTTVGSPFSYTVNLTGGCGTISASGTISVTPDNTIALTSVAGTDAQTVCTSSAITNITYFTTGATSVTFSGLPTGVSGSWAGNVATISGTPTTNVGSPFNYTVNLSGGCGTISVNGTITVNPLPVITSTSSTNVTVCAGSDGTITINATGFAPLEYSINGGTNFYTNSGLFNSLSNGVYNIVVENGYGCTANGGNISISDGGAPPAPAAGTNATYCSGATLSDLNATASTGGSLTWYSNPGLTTVIGNGTTLTPFNNVGISNYYVTETVAGCQSAATLVTITITALPTANISYTGTPFCISNSTPQSANLTGTTGGSFSVLPSGLSIDPFSGSVSPNSSTAGLYTVTYTISAAGGCPQVDATASVTIGPLPTTADAGTDQIICGTSSTMAGNIAAIGTGTWTLISGTGTTTTPSSPTSAVTGLSTGVNVFEWAIDNPPCASSSDQISITVTSTPTISVAGTDQSVCGTMATLAGNTAIIGTGTWTLISGSGTLTTPTSPTSGIVGLGVGPNVFEWTISNPPCAPSSSQVTITGVASPTIADAGTDQTLCGSTTTLAGNTATIGTGTWSLVSGSGTITTPSSPTSGIIGLAVGVNVFQWTIANTPCSSSSDQVSIIITSMPTVAAAGTNQSVCGTTATLAGNTAIIGTGIWTLISGSGTITTPSSPTSGIVGLGVGPNVFEWTISSPPCSPSSSQVTITGVASPTTAIAGADQTLCGNSATLAGNTATTGTGTWTLISGSGVITNPSSETSSITGLAVGVNVFEWTIANAPCTSSSDQVSITISTTPTISVAGTDQSVCGTTATLAGNTAANGTGMWTLISGTGTITTPSSPNSGLIGLGIGPNVFEWIISNPPCAPSSSQVTITSVASPTTSDAGPDQTLCSNTASLAGNTATIGTGTWILISGSGTITTPSSPTSGITGLNAGINVFEWTIVNAPCTSSSDQVSITILSTPTTAIAGTDNSICGTTETLAGNNATTGTGLWTLVSGAGTITTPSSPTSGITGLGIGANVFEWTISNPPCTPSSDQVTITGVATPTSANAGLDQTLTFGTSTSTLAGNVATTGTGTWTVISGSASITTPSSPTSGITGLSTGLSILQWTIVNPPCPSSSDTVTINIPEIPIEIPSVFTPNGDGKNDLFEIKHIDLYPEASIEIYNRWGDLIYKSDNYANPANWWDAKYNGKESPMGSYVYILKLSEDKDVIKGIISIVK